MDEYLTVLRSLQAGFGIGTRQELEQLCCLVWAKSEEESRLIRRLFEQMWRYSPDTADQPKPSSPSPESEDSSAKIPESEPLPELEPQPNLTPEPVQAVQAVRSSGRERELRRPRYSLLTEYFPVTRRQMKQTWRYLRRPVREGIPTGLADIEAPPYLSEEQDLSLQGLYLYYSQARPILTAFVRDYSQWLISLYPSIEELLNIFDATALKLDREGFGRMYGFCRGALPAFRGEVWY